MPRSAHFGVGLPGAGTAVLTCTVWTRRGATSTGTLTLDERPCP
ncbi:MAG TPA: hypothetical protein VF605_01225 [Allosphingosinicella sp.]|jgi:hypothetical protein